MPDRSDTPPTLASLRRRSRSSRSVANSLPPAIGNQADLFSAGVSPGHSAIRVAQSQVALQTAATERRVWSVRALVTDIRQHLETDHADLWVHGEISNCRPAPSGHIYFTLKDGDAQLPVVLFRRHAQLLRFVPKDGMAILVRGRISVFESRGQLQLIAETLEPRGAGALQIAFDQLKARLVTEGLFLAERKRPLPAFPHCIGIVTSTSGAAIRDMVTVIQRRHARLNLLIYPAAMQGEECCSSVASGIRWFNNHPGQVDLIVLARGGGSIEDLSGFNNEALARIIAASSLPIVSAIGHETDFTIADFVADLRAPTPSAAAELITAAQHRIEEQVESLTARVHRAIRYRMIHARQSFSRLSSDRVFGTLRNAINRRDQRIDDLRHRVEGITSRQIDRRSARLGALALRLHRVDPRVLLAHAQRRLQTLSHRLNLLPAAVIRRRTARLNYLSRRLDLLPNALNAGRAARIHQAVGRLHALSPLAVLNRGYALVYLEGSSLQNGQAEGVFLRSSTEVAPGQQIRARLAAGSVRATITETTNS